MDPSFVNELLKTVGADISDPLVQATHSQLDPTGERRDEKKGEGGEPEEGEQNKGKKRKNEDS